MRSLTLGIYTLIIITVVNTVGGWARTKIEDAGSTGTTTQQLCQVDTSYCN